MWSTVCQPDVGGKRHESAVALIRLYEGYCLQILDLRAEGELPVCLDGLVLHLTPDTENNL